MERHTGFQFGTAAVLAAVASVAAPLAGADDSNYQFIVSGDTVSAATANTSSGESDTVAIDGVNRTVAESEATHLFSDKEGPTTFILK